MLSPKVHLRRANAGLLLGAVLWFCGVAGSLAPAQRPTASEYELKALYLINFARFIEWPAVALPAADTPVNIGILGDDPFGNLFDKTVKDESIQGHPIVLKRTKRLPDLKMCQVVFVCRSERSRYSQIMAGLAKDGVLTVGESEDFAGYGGIITFCVQNNKVQFDISLPAAERASLKMSAKLLQLAKPCGRSRAAGGE
jgi:hypothetical protein